MYLAAAKQWETANLRLISKCLARLMLRSSLALQRTLPYDMAGTPCLMFICQVLMYGQVIQAQGLLHL